MNFIKKNISFVKTMGDIKIGDDTCIFRRTAENSYVHNATVRTQCDMSHYTCKNRRQKPSTVSENCRKTCRGWNRKIHSPTRVVERICKKNSSRGKPTRRQLSSTLYTRPIFPTDCNWWFFFRFFCYCDMKLQFYRFFHIIFKYKILKIWINLSDHFD